MKFLFAGDFYPNTENAKALIKEGKYDHIVKEVTPFIQSADFSLVNFESPIADSNCLKPFIQKGPKNLCSDKKAIECVKYAGFSMIALANNHFHDFGDEGVSQTIEACRIIGMPFCGAGLDKAHAQQPVIYDSSDRKIGVINFCENEFSVATETSAGANPFDLVGIVHQIADLRAKTDYIIVFVHGGVEHYQLPTPMMQKTYRFLIEMGADMVVNSHQHCYSGYEMYRGRPIVYGLGNFFFDNNAVTATKWNEGYMALIEEEGGAYSIKTLPYLQGMSSATITMLSDTMIFEDKIAALNGIIQDSEVLGKKFENFVLNNKRTLLSIFEPYQSRLALRLYRMGLLPSLLSKKKQVLILNRLRCESHRLVSSKLFSQSLGLPF